MNQKIVTATAVGAIAAVIGTTVVLYPAKSETAAIDDISAITVDVPTVMALDAAPEITAPERLQAATVEALLPVADPPPQVTVDSVTSDIPLYKKMLTFQRAMLRDQRSREHDPELGRIDSAAWSKWQRIYLDPEILNYKMSYKKLSTGLRIISEVRCPRSDGEMATLTRRLAEYRRKNFNAVLVCFDTTEDTLKLATTIDYIRSTGMKVIIVYIGGKESLRAPVFRDPDRIADFFQRLAPRADAVLLGHWRTSVHLFLPDKAYTNYIIRCARKANPEIAVIGQAYWGQTADTGTEEKDFTTTVAVPENSSAVLITGLGYPGAANAVALKKLFSEVADHPHKIALVVGEKPYYSSTRPTRRSRKFNELVKRQLERRLLKIGCQSTLTFSADGSNRPGSSENLCLEPGT